MHLKERKSPCREGKSEKILRVLYLLTFVSNNNTMHCVLGIHLKEATDAINKLVDESIGKNTAKSRLKIMV